MDRQDGVDISQARTENRLRAVRAKVNRSIRPWPTDRDNRQGQVLTLPGSIMSALRRLSRLPVTSGEKEEGGGCRTFNAIVLSTYYKKNNQFSVMIQSQTNYGLYT